MNKKFALNLCVGVAAGAIAFLSGSLNLPLSFAVCFVVASAMNLLMLRA